MPIDKVAKLTKPTKATKSSTSKRVGGKPKRIEYKCHSCGGVFLTQTGNFYKTSQNSPLWISNNGFVPICKTCIDKFKSVLMEKYKSEEYALKVICHYMDWYYSCDAYTAIAKNTQQFTAGIYSRLVNNNIQYSEKTFLDSIADGELQKESDVAKIKATERGKVYNPYDASWDEKDEKNRKYVIETYGYDPLEDMVDLSIQDQKFCYNALSGYCDTEGISEDGHKMMCVVSIVKSFLQIKKIDDEINKVSNDFEMDESKIKTLMASKKTALDTITTLAKDNNISSQWNKSVRAGHGTMSDKIREMYDNGFEPARANLFDIKTCESIKQTADLSNKSIMEQLQLDDNDYTRIIRDQREMVQSLTSEVDTLREQNRQLRNKVIFLEKGKGDK